MLLRLGSTAGCDAGGIDADGTAAGEDALEGTPGPAADRDGAEALTGPTEGAAAGGVTAAVGRGDDATTAAVGVGGTAVSAGAIVGGCKGVLGEGVGVLGGVGSCRGDWTGVWMPEEIVASGGEAGELESEELP